jgi:hypothetical protein
MIAVFLLDVSKRKQALIMFLIRYKEFIVDLADFFIHFWDVWKCAWVIGVNEKQSFFPAQDLILMQLPLHA